ncbi:copper amine oxidase N-terminal domain-containing protein [Heliorestis convoluta]|uniref:Copper amine oxidase N-terminal domain-containing protein n=1 Tax=Heliorestis convoluta TaxID=356322 RepID=A0A5Q2N4K6_9FIRM|nr:copper amine oxidase N-terminal domain-containing protein [Heliorestis convoluta]QGG47190.1 copper amine oxidase N-terminal domain-containing protein [Heliorestis convoluta]
MISKANKKMLAIVTAFMFMFTVFAPIGMIGEAEAASKNRVDRVVYVDKDENFEDLARVPYLIIQDEDGDFGASERFRLQLPGSAEWNLGETTATSAAVSATSGAIASTTGAATQYQIRVISDQIIDVTLSGILKSQTFHIPLNVDLDNASGEIKVTVNPMDSAVSSGTYTFAVVESGGTIATVGEKRDVTRGNAHGATITIDEARIGALDPGTQEFRLRLPSGFNWNATLTSGSAVVEGLGNTATLEARIGANDRTLEVTVRNIVRSSDSRGYIAITPYFNITRDANLGDVKVDILSRSSDVTAVSGLVVAEYIEHGVTVSIDEVREFLAGRAAVGNLADLDEEEFETAEITIEQNGRALLDGRIVEFELPSWVKVAVAENADHETVFDEIFGDGSAVFERNSFWINSDRNRFEVTVEDSTEADEIELVIPLLIEADKTGKIYLNIKGAGIAEQNLLIGTAIAPVEVDIKVADVRIGVQNQSAPDIVITENQAGALMEGSLVIDLRQFDGLRFTDATFEVIAGDLEIDVDASDVDDHRLTIVIEADSTEPSTIKVSNIELTVNRMAPEGFVQVDVSGDALIGYVSINGEDAIERDADSGTFNTRVARVNFANVITPAPGQVRSAATFVIGENVYTVNGVEKQMDAAPYIKDGRTFLPVRFVADALGVSENNIIWNQATQSATIIKGDRIVSVQIGNNVMTVNGTPLTMDVAPEIRDGRTFLPLRFIGQALGADMEWVAETQTVIVNQ